MKTHKKLLSAVIIIALLFSLVACGKKAETPTSSASSEGAGSAVSETQTPTKEDGGKLIMATEPSFPPYEYLDVTEIVGVDIDIAREIAKEMGKELVVESMDFDAVIPAVQSGKVDFGASGMSVTDARLEQVAFSIEYAKSSQVIMTKSDSGISSGDDLSGKNVGVQLGTVADIVLSEEYADVNLARGKKYTDISLELNNGVIDAIVLDRLTAEAISAKFENMIILEEPLFTDSYAIAVAKGNDEMLTVINTVLERLIAEGKIEEFTLKHLGE